MLPTSQLKADLGVFLHETIVESERTSQNLRTYLHHITRLCSSWCDLADPKAFHARFCKEEEGVSSSGALGRRPRLEANLKQRSASARNQMLWTLRKVIPWAVEHGFLPLETNALLAGIRRAKFKTKPTLRMPTSEQMRMFLEAITKEDKRLGYFAWWMATTGLRRSAALGARWENIDEVRGVIWGITSKGRELVIPMLADVANS